MMNDKTLTNEEKAELSRRKVEIAVQKKTKQSSTLDDLKKELGLPSKGTKK